MKKLTIEEKAKHYDEAIERANELKYVSDKGSLQRKTVERIFPELKENEDERIREELVEHFKWNSQQVLNEFANKEVLAWLEKKRDNISIDFVLGYLGIKPAYKDGNAWCILLGDNIQEGICGFGDTKEEALIDFMKELIEKQGQTFTKKDVDDAYLKGISDTKNEMENQHEANYQIRKDIATFIFNYKGDIKDRSKWMDYLGIKVSFAENKGEQNPQGKSALEAINEEKVDNQNCVKPADNIESSAFKDKLLELFQKFRYIKEGVPTNGDIIDYVDAHIQELIDTIQNKSWSKEDENMIEAALQFAHEYGRHGLWAWLKGLKNRIKPQTTSKPSDEHYELKEFAKIIRGNLIGISKPVQKLFEAKYLELTGKKMYGGFKD